MQIFPHINRDERPEAADDKHPRGQCESNKEQPGVMKDKIHSLSHVTPDAPELGWTGSGRCRRQLKWLASTKAIEPMSKAEPTKLAESAR